MRVPRLPLLIALVVFAGVGGWAQTSGLTQRVRNTTLHMPASPPAYGYQTANSPVPVTGYFINPTVIASPPGETNRLFVAEQAGQIEVVTNLGDTFPMKAPFPFLAVGVAGGTPTDERGLLGLAFHPGYATNRYFYVFRTAISTTPGIATNALHDVLSRFQTRADNPNVADPNSELILINQYDQAANHNGGDLHFGPDGYLYVSLGDEGGGDDQYNNSQRIDKDFFSGILRIDVDKLPTSLPANPHPSNTNNPANTINYAIPPDNPFVGATNFNGLPVNSANVRTEFYAVGLRNPWRFSFDPATGFLYCGDVGQNAWEEVDIIVKGGNYGWNYREGLHPGPRTPPTGFTSIDPIQEYGHGNATNQGNSVTGGVVYRGKRFSQLFGAYVFADYVSGNIWALRYEGTNTVPFGPLTREGGISAFGIDPINGDVLMANQGADTIKRLTYNTNISGLALPATLADTGAFSDLVSLAPNPGIVPYDINVPFWSDNARKMRWFSVPDTNLAIGFNPDGNWSFPTGAVWIKHFDLELTNGVPESRKRLETRFIVRNAGGVYGVTYRWDSATNATLVPEGGMDEAFAVDDGGTVRTQVWHYPSRAECLACHTAAGGGALGFNTPQMNRDIDYGGGTESQIAALSRVGYFTAPVTNLNTLRALAHPTNTAYSVEYRVHSYLTANCSQCHQPGGTALGFWDARITTPMSEAGIINGALNNNGGDADNRVIAPGSLDHSMMLTRISQRGPGQMPPLDSTLPDTDALGLLSAWITNDLPDYQSFAAWQSAHFGSTTSPDAAADADPDHDGANNLLEYFTETDPMSGGDAWKINAQPDGGAVAISFPQIANRGFQVEWASAPVSPTSWQPLDVAANRPFFSRTNFTATVTDAITNAPCKFYRVRVFDR